MDTTCDLGGLGPKAIGKRVLDLRLAADLSQGDLAARTKADGADGVSAGYVSLVERGAVRSSYDKLSAIARALGFRDAGAMLHAALPDVEGNPPPSETNHLRVVRGGGRVSSAPADGSGARPTDRGADAGNVGRILDDAGGDHRRPVYRWGTLGDPTSVDDAPVPHRRVPLWPEQEAMVGQRGFGVEVRGSSMRGWRTPIVDGEICWVNPDEPYSHGDVVVAERRNGGDSGMVVKEWNLAPDGRECLFSNHASEDGGRQVFACESYRVIGPVVGIGGRWRSPDE